MSLQNLWQQKSDQELRNAIEQFNDYTESAQQVIREELRRRGMPEPPLSIHSNIELQNTSESLPSDYANLWKRFSAAWLDGIALRLLTSLLIYTIDPRSTANPEVIFYWSLGINVLLGWLYYAIAESSLRQATFGKEAMKIIVTDLNGNRITFEQATARYFGKWLSIPTLFIGFVIAAFTKKRQALHDLLAGTLVLSK